MGSTMRKAFILFATIVISFSAYATPPTDESIDSLLAATQAEKIGESVFANIDKIMKQTLAEALKQKQVSAEQQRMLDAMHVKYAQVMRDELSWTSMRPLYVQIYKETFTQEEIDGLIAFYRSPVGAAFVEKMPLAMQKSMSIMQARVGPLMERMSAAMKEAVDEARMQK